MAVPLLFAIKTRCLFHQGLEVSSPPSHYGIQKRHTIGVESSWEIRVRKIEPLCGCSDFSSLTRGRASHTKVEAGEGLDVPNHPSPNQLDSLQDLHAAVCP
eukprot:1308044-Rhodomonas_salina.1